MDEHHWMTSHECLFVIGCKMLGLMPERIMMDLGILLGFVSSQLGFVRALRS